VVLMFAAWPFFSGFFRRKWGEAVDPAVLAPPDGAVKVRPRP
jgi:hypothetical protein